VLRNRAGALIGITTLLTGEAEGAFTLPAEIKEAASALAAVATARGGAGSSRVVSNETALREDAIAAVIKGEPLPDLEPILEARESAKRAAELQELGQKILTEAHEDITLRLGGLVTSMTDEIITAHLQPALEEVLRGSREALAELDSHDATDPESLIGAPQSVQRAYRRLQHLARRYGVLRDVREVLLRDRQMYNRDPSNLHSEFRNATDVFPRWGISEEVPWPEGSPLGRFVWLIENSPPLQPWMPTLEEQNKAADEAREGAQFIAANV
jgi:hypothetical protein